jgi:hypothetical protein
MKTFCTSLIASILLLAFICNGQTFAQENQGFIYGKVVTVDDESYTGLIRWGKEEIFWFDIFNSTKTKNENLKHLTKDEMKLLSENTKSWFDGWADGNININFDGDNYLHSFACMFGDIQSLKIIGSSKVNLVLKNGDEMKLSGGSNDIGTSISVLDEEIGLITLDWDRVVQVDFMPTPGNIKEVMGNALHGTVYTGNGKFTGYIQWDHDERISTDKLDGESKNGDVSIDFENIKAIVKSGRGCDLVLHSGREMFVEGSNDVNDGNRGIIVNMPDVGRVDIKWQDFEKVLFDADVNSSGSAYDNYQPAKKLAGSVITKDGEMISGAIIFDLDEVYNIEILQGNSDDIEYLIPFRNIKTISPKNYKYSRVILTNGEELTLSGSHDVTDDNDGAIVFESSSKHSYIPWKEIGEISFKIGQ